MSDDGNRRPVRALRLALQAAMSANAAAFGFSIAITGALAAVAHRHGSPTAVEVLLFGAGAVAAFTILDLAATEGFKLSVRKESSDVTTHATAFGFVSVGAAIGAAIVSSEVVSGSWAWPIGSFAAAGAYILLVAVEMAVAEAVESRRR